MSILQANGVAIERFTVNNPARLQELVACYRAVFGGAPWSEWKKCAVCGSKWGVEEDIPETHCGQMPEEFWPSATVESDIRHEVTEQASCWVATTGSDVVGFCWGYPIAVSNLEQKLVLPGFAEALRAKKGNVSHVAYQDELGVRPEFRGCGIAKAMYTARHADFLSRGLTVGVVRTKRTPPTVTYSWFLKIGYGLVSEYNDSDDRVILARDIVNITL